MKRISIAPTQLNNDKIILTVEQQHYLYRVLRLDRFSRFIAMDGGGKSWLAELTGNSEARILETLVQDRELAVSLTLMVALPKGNGFDQIVRCCTELGACCFVTVKSDRTLLQPSGNKFSRWRKIAAEAAEQSERQIVPVVREIVDFATACQLSRESVTNCYLCVARNNAPHLLPALENRRQGNILIATGPEGGWTQEEIGMAVSCGFQPVSLGKRILRAITAPIFATSLVAATLES